MLGLYQCPTIVNNVETLCHVKHIAEMGGEAFARIGTPNNTGTRLLCVSGHVQRPGYYEFESGKITLGQLLNEVCGGPRPGRRFKAVIPGGSSSKVLRFGERFKVQTAGRHDCRLGRGGHPDGLRFAGRVRHHGRLRRHHRDGRLGRHRGRAGQPQRLLRPRELRPVHALPRGLAVDEEDHRTHGARRRRGPQDGELLKSVADQIAGRTICPFGEACAWPTQSFVQKFGDEFTATRGQKRSPPTRRIGLI